MVFTNLTTGDEHLAMETESEAGSGRLWVIRWQDEIRPLTSSLGALLSLGAHRFVDIQARWDPVDELFDWDYDREEQLDLFP